MATMGEADEQALEEKRLPVLYNRGPVQRIEEHREKMKKDK